MKYTKKEIFENVLTRREAEQYLELSSSALQHHLRNGKIKSAKEVGNGKGKVQLFWKPDLDRYLKGNKER